MNFIAHIHLSRSVPAILVGNYIADLIRLKESQSLPQDVQKGVILHRLIDTFTDNHEVNKNMLEHIYPRHRKYAAVLLDIYYDYFLIRHWSLFSVKSFYETCEEAYGILENNLNIIPPSAQPNIENLLNKRWLTDAYSSIEGLERTFHFLKMRMSKPEIIENASKTLIELEPELEHAFLTYYPQLIEVTKDGFPDK